MQSNLPKPQEAVTDLCTLLTDLNPNLDSCHLFCILRKLSSGLVFASYYKIIKKSRLPKEVWRLLYLHTVENEASFSSSVAKLYVIFITLLRFENISAQMLHIMAALPLIWILSNSGQVLLHLRIIDPVEVTHPASKWTQNKRLMHWYGVQCSTFQWLRMTGKWISPTTTEGGQIHSFNPKPLRQPRH